ncbi:hypothetical protein D3C74_500710 [compost metagenome]
MVVTLKYDQFPAALVPGWRSTPLRRMEPTEVIPDAERPAAVSQHAGGLQHL